MNLAFSSVIEPARVACTYDKLILTHLSFSHAEKKQIVATFTYYCSSTEELHPEGKSETLIIRDLDSFGSSYSEVIDSWDAAESKLVDSAELQFLEKIDSPSAEQSTRLAALKSSLA
jgi:hypothetical protein